ncbi:hypothetical protein HFP15_24895 [Amycolatopsis sp. K13G38]|uniref:DUF4286 family protein n=1 Tax=Amycolatopsis acididurans TaxID=2724524 RepID=A0ABX1JBY8_9PSEU|nr:hypothetical protein [Amycolatopsis acididurans]NKQ56120.1 hypothetical protein [Amycolatopsis acididurans]
MGTQPPAPFVYVVWCEFAPGEDLPDWHRWYDEVHIPGMLSVPGISAVHRCQLLGRENQFLAIYDIESPAVFDHPRYAEVRGWGPWQGHIVSWSREVLSRTGAIGEATGRQAT